MSESNPLVSVGMPVYNGERYLPAALESVLCQDFSDFELIISDNASDDGTAEMCQEVALQDPRVRYTRNSQNIGPSENFWKVLLESKGEFFCWAAHDDLRDRQFIRVLVDSLLRTPDAVASMSWVVVIDADGTPVKGPFKPFAKSLGHLARAARVRRLLQESPIPFVVYGMFRRAWLLQALEITRGRKDAMGSDVLLALKCADLGSISVVEQPLFFYREGGGSTSADFYQSVGQVIKSLVDYSWRVWRVFDSRGVTWREQALVYISILAHISRRWRNWFPWALLRRRLRAGLNAVFGRKRVDRVWLISRAAIVGYYNNHCGSLPAEPKCDRESTDSHHS